MPRLVKLAAIQAAPVSFDLQSTLKKAAELVADAAEKGAQLWSVAVDRKKRS